MTKSKSIGRGNNRNSQNNKPKLGKEAEYTSAKLLPHQKQTALELGNNNFSDGMRKALDICSRDYSNLDNPTKLVVLLTVAQSAPEPTKSEIIQEALDYLESWSIERDYSETIAEGTIKTKGGAYIV